MNKGDVGGDGGVSSNCRCWRVGAWSGCCHLGAGQGGQQGGQGACSAGRLSGGELF